MTSKDNRKGVNYLNRYKNLTHIFIWVAVFLWMVLIFNLSSQVAEQSSALSSKITEIIIEIVEKFTLERNVKIDARTLNNLIRKESHFFIYLILGILFMGTIRRSGIHGARGVIITLLFCSFFAISDEVHQLFVLGRGAQIKDVLIDIAGTIVGISAYLAKGVMRTRVMGPDTLSLLEPQRQIMRQDKG